MKEENKPSKETLEKWHQDSNNWKFGVFYFNKDDKRIFPPKRLTQFGWTINFANPLSILVIVLIIVTTILITKHRV